MINTINLTANPLTRKIEGEIIGDPEELKNMVAHLCQEKPEMFEILDRGVSLGRERIARACNEESGPPEPFVSFKYHDKEMSVTTVLGRADEVINLIVDGMAQNETVFTLFTEVTRRAKKENGVQFIELERFSDKHDAVGVNGNHKELIEMLAGIILRDKEFSSILNNAMAIVRIELLKPKTTEEKPN